MSTKEELADYYITFNMVTEPLVEKWEKTGLLEGLNAKDMSQNKMAMLLENQTRQIYADNDHRKGQRTVEFEKGIVLPLVRLVFGPYLSNENVMVSALPANHIPIDGELTAVATFEQRFDFPDVITPPDPSGFYSGIDAEAEFCSIVRDEMAKHLHLFLDSNFPVLVFMPFARQLVVQTEQGLGVTGFSTRWYHDSAF